MQMHRNYINLTACDDGSVFAACNYASLAVSRHMQVSQALALLHNPQTFSSCENFQDFAVREVTFM